MGATENAACAICAKQFVAEKVNAINGKVNRVKILVFIAKTLPFGYPDSRVKDKKSAESDFTRPTLRGSRIAHYCRNEQRRNHALCKQTI